MNKKVGKLINIKFKEVTNQV